MRRRSERRVWRKKSIKLDQSWSGAAATTVATLPGTGLCKTLRFTLARIIFHTDSQIKIESAAPQAFIGLIYHSCLLASRRLLLLLHHPSGRTRRRIGFDKGRRVREKESERQNKNVWRKSR